MILIPQLLNDVNMDLVVGQEFLVAKNFHVPKSDTRIHEALVKGSKYSELKQLLAHGARVSDQNNEGHTAVHVAFLNSASGRILDFLLASYLSETSKNLKNKNNLSVLHIACSRPRLEIVEKLAECNEDDINIQIDEQADADIAGYTPVHMAVEHDRYEVIGYLAENYIVDLSVQNRFGSTPLHIALDRRSVPMIDLILEYDDDYRDIVDDSGLTHFMAACAGSSITPVINYLDQRKTWASKKALVDAQVHRDLSEYNYAGYTSLHFAAEFGRYEIMEVLLLYCSATCFAQNCKKLTPLAVTIQRGHVEIARLLFKFYKTYSKAMFINMKMDD